MYEVGRIIKPHGLKGFVKIHILSTEKDRFRVGTSYIIDNEEYTIEDIKGIGSKPLIKFFEIDSRSEADKLKDSILYVKEDDLVPLEENEYYIHDILVCTVYDSSGSKLGPIDNLYFAGPSPVIEIAGSDLGIPLNREMIESIDISNEKIVLKHTAEYYEF